MFLFHSFHPKSLRRTLMRSVSTLCILSCLFAVLLFTGCNQEEEDDEAGFVLEGKWISSWGDSYTITKTSVDYFMDNSAYGFNDTVFKGNIAKAIVASNNAGLLIIEVTEASDFTVGKFACVCYKEGKKTSVKMSTAFNADYSPLEKDSLAEAQSAFTVNAMDTLIETWGDYTK